MSKCLMISRDARKAFVTDKSENDIQILFTRAELLGQQEIACVKRQLPRSPFITLQDLARLCLLTDCKCAML
jgi:hypothetical protein